MKWQPIETIPYNKFVLIYASKCGTITNARLVHNTKDVLGFYDAQDRNSFHESVVTHWMRAPKPPKAEE